MLILLIVFVSYLFIWQPFYGPDVDEEQFELNENALVADDSNSYLVKNQDGTYSFYFEGYPPMEVTQEEIDNGMFEGYPIIEK